MKIAITGKGGAGKTTLTSMLAATLNLEGQSVIALDADPDANLAAALGIPPSEQPTPLSEMGDLIAERTGAEDNYSGYFKLNPKVDDIPETYAAKIDRIRLLVLGGVSQGGGGCICPASSSNLLMRSISRSNFMSSSFPYFCLIFSPMRRSYSNSIISRVFVIGSK